MQSPRPTSPPTRLRVRLLLAVGSVLVITGLVIGLYVVYALVLTGRETAAVQSELREAWAAADAEGIEPSGAGETGDDLDAGDDEGDAATADAASPDAGVALLEAHPEDGSASPLGDEPLVVVSGTTYEELKRGPGHYPHSAAPGEDGNVAVAGHRTTYGAPFFDLDALAAGDRLDLTDQEGERHHYEVREQRVVQPHDTWVVGDDPLDLDAPTLTLTTCHPRFSAAERLVVFAELVDGEEP